MYYPQNPYAQQPQIVYVPTTQMNPQMYMYQQQPGYPQQFQQPGYPQQYQQQMPVYQQPMQVVPVQAPVIDTTLVAPQQNNMPQDTNNPEEEVKIDPSKFPSFDFFTSEKAKNIKFPDTSPAPVTGITEKKKRAYKKKDDEIAITSPTNPNAPYEKSYEETNNLLKGAIIQTDQLNAEIKEDIDVIRASKTIKNKYTYLTNLSSSSAGLIGTKIAAIKELNNSITQAHTLELRRMKDTVDTSNVNDDRKMMDMYNAFINTPIGNYVPTGITTRDISSSMSTGSVEPVMISAGPSSDSTDPGMQNYLSNLTPEQNSMRMESNPNIQTVVVFNNETGARYFDVVDKTTGQSIPNVSKPDNFLLEDTVIDVAHGVASNRNIKSTWPLVCTGDGDISEY